MKPKMMLKISVDLGMTVLLMLLMAFELIGQTAHEWIGAGLFLLFLLHHILNWNGSRGLFRGSCTPVRVLQALLAALVLLTMLGSLVSAVLISREVFAFLPIQGGRALGRSLHMLCAYWGFVFLSLHLGFHWNMILSMARKLVKGDSRIRRAALSLLGACTAAYGAYALFHRNIPSYLFLQTQFVFFDFEEPLVFFFLDYLAVMGLFVWLGHLPAKGGTAAAAEEGAPVKALRFTAERLPPCPMPA